MEGLLERGRRVVRFSGAGLFLLREVSRKGEGVVGL